MTHKCYLCKKEITATFLDKFNGTIIKTKKDEALKTVYICSSCQKEHKENLREKVSK
jgi:gluconate kinase